MRQDARGTLHIDDEPAAEIQEQNSGSGSGSNNDTSSDDGEEDDETYKMSPCGLKRSGRFMRGSSSSGSHGASSGNGSGQHGEDEEEDENVQSGQPVFVTEVMMRKPSVPHDYVKVDYMKREEQARQQAAAQGEGGDIPTASTHVPRAPHAPSRSHSKRGGSRGQNWENPPSPIRKMFNLIFGMCKSTNDVIHKERQRRKKDILRLKKMQEVTLPNDAPSPIGSEGQQSEPGNLEQLNTRYQQEDYWGQLYSSGSFLSNFYVNPTYVDPSTAPMPLPPPFMP
ncbi:hypothetical protein C2845_PM08G16750 [Panicum miliaceum]|uniref:Uncharacterized protein n=1 Tax=Panicum miliaceum TaxID=4540 RepID=A0A3L6QVA9_PANMI|nr:hypothetical protein C2845_PM08G16750 [Panicum miliaceum]